MPNEFAKKKFQDEPQTPDTVTTHSCIIPDTFGHGQRKTQLFMILTIVKFSITQVHGQLKD